MSTHLIAHFGDLHLKVGSPRNADRRRVFHQAIDDVLAIAGLGAAVIPGDLFDGPFTTDVSDRNFLDVELQRLAMKAPVIITKGNHDPHGDLDGFARLRATYPIEVVTSPHVLQLRLATGAMASIYCYPYPERAGVVAAGASPSEVVGIAKGYLDAAFIAAGVELAEARGRGHVTFMIGHVNIAGSRASSGQPQIGKEIELDPACLGYLGPIYKGLNHIHRGQEIADAWYAGSMGRQDRGEVEPKRWLLVEIADDSSYQVVERPIDVAPIYYLEGELTRAGFTFRALAGKGGDVLPTPASWAGCEVHVCYRFDAAEKDVLDHDVVAVGFRDALRVTYEPIAVTAREIRAPQVVTAQTIEQKFDAWLELDGRESTSRQHDAIADLQQRPSDSLLSDLAAWIAAVEADDPTPSLADVLQEVR